jgi:hypothetical protein
MHSPWKLLFASVAGTSHERRNQPCQDYSHGRVICGEGSSVLIAACADGAGTASHATLGARIACLGVLSAAGDAIESGLSVADITNRHLLHWHEQVRGKLSLEACLRNLDLREFASTLLTVIVDRDAAIFSQIGDGAIVFKDGTGYQTAVWPQSGEYVNTTYFLTSTDWWERLAVRTVSGEVDELALLTDGLQPLALQYGTRSVHEPFFDPMFTSLRQVTQTEDLEGPLKQFLDSPAVNERTDDDKTLMLATRRPKVDDHP